MSNDELELRRRHFLQVAGGAFMSLVAGSGVGASSPRPGRHLSRP
jgi:hypothetical protein